MLVGHHGQRVCEVQWQASLLILLSLESLPGNAIIFANHLFFSLSCIRHYLLVEKTELARWNVFF